MILNISRRWGSPAFWIELLQMKDANDLKKYGILAEFMSMLMALSHSSAGVERVFSQVKLIKTKQSNKLLCEKVKSRLLAKQAIASDGACYEFNPSKSMVDDDIERRCWQR